MSERVSVMIDGLNVVVEAGEIRGSDGSFATIRGAGAGALGRLVDPAGEHIWEHIALVRMDRTAEETAELDARLAGLHDLVEALLAARTQAVLGE